MTVASKWHNIRTWQNCSRLKPLKMTEWGYYDESDAVLCIRQLKNYYSAPNKESTFLEILISGVKSTFSHSNHHKSMKERFWISFLKKFFPPYI